MAKPVWTTALPDWEERIIAGKSLVPCGPLFPAEAEAAMRIFGDLRVADIAGKPTMRQICRPWLWEFVQSIFGAYDPESGRRLINEFFLLISKKNMKSTGAADIMVTALLRNWRESAEFGILAPTLEIANNSADPAMDMVRNTPGLMDILKPIPHLRMIEHRTTGATLKVVAADTDTVGGSKFAGVLIEELWLFGKRPKAREMLREATGGLTARPEGFVIALSTQSDEPPAGVFKDWLQKYRDIRDGKLHAPECLGVLYEFPQHLLDAEAYKDPKYFYITNPNLGASVDEESLIKKYRDAQREGAESLAGFFAKHLNVEVGQNLRANRWPGAEFWERQTDKTITLETMLERCEVIVVGLDGGGLDDLFGLTLVGREPADVEVEVVVNGERQTMTTKRWLTWSHAWCHASVLERRKSIASKLKDFAAAGELTICGDDLSDIAGIVDIVRQVDQAGLLACVAADPAGLGEMVDALAEIDVTVENEKLVGVPQGFGLMNAIKTTERKLANGTLWHAPSGLMAWAVANLKIEPTATAIRATKQNAGDAKVDPAMAMFNGSFVMSRNPAARSAFPADYDLLVI